MINLKNILLHKFKERTLAPFYILKAPSGSAAKKEFLGQWISDYLLDCAEIATPHKNKDKGPEWRPLERGHPDVLFISRGGKGEEYATKYFEEFFRFLNFKPFEWPHRFIVIEEAHLIGESIGNKLLKALENPGDYTTVFFLLSVEKTMLSTLQSRAIQLRLSINREENSSPLKFYSSSEIPSWTQENPFFSPLSQEFKELITALLRREKFSSDLVDAIKRKKVSPEEFLSFAIEWERNHQSSYQIKEKFLEELKWFAEAQTYSNALGERIHSFLQSLISSLPAP